VHLGRQHKPGKPVEERYEMSIWRYQEPPELLERQRAGTTMRQALAPEHVLEGVCTSPDGV
jgi:hypothetical protein